jgi:N-acetylglucosamine-6-phosphate deacetylase
MNHRFANGRIVTPGGVLDGAALTLDAAGRIAGIETLNDANEAIDLDGGWLVPGFIDTQVNGGGGVLFNDDPSVAAIEAIGDAHRRYGTTAFLPTLISDRVDRIAAALEATDAAIARGVPGVVGTHIEGPFINADRRGIHDAAHIRTIDEASLALLCRPRAGKIMVTLAPEQSTPETIRTLVTHGVIVSIGHSNAQYDQAIAAADAGATGVTHLFNAMSPLGHRAPGVVGAALDDHRLFAGLIVDRVHVDPAAVRIAIAAKGVDRIMLVTDAMPGVGTTADRFELQGKTIRIDDGTCRYADGTLAGSHLDMAAAVRNTVAITGRSVDQVSTMASATPATFLGIADGHGSIARGQRADWVWLDRDLHVRATWIAGNLVEAHL